METVEEKEQASTSAAVKFHSAIACDDYGFLQLENHNKAHS